MRCSPGTYQPFAGLDFCYACPVGKFSAVAGSVTDNCRRCPETYTTKKEGSANANECVCAPGFQPEGLCQECAFSAGYFKRGFGNYSCLLCNNGSLGHVLVSSSECSCAQGYYEDAMHCSKCPYPKTSLSQGARNVSQCDQCDMSLNVVKVNGLCQCLEGFREADVPKTGCVNCKDQINEADNVGAEPDIKDVICSPTLRVTTPGTGNTFSSTARHVGPSLLRDALLFAAMASWTLVSQY